MSALWALRARTMRSIAKLNISCLTFVTVRELTKRALRMSKQGPWPNAEDFPFALWPIW